MNGLAAAGVEVVVVVLVVVSELVARGLEVVYAVLCDGPLLQAPKTPNIVAAPTTAAIGRLQRI